VEAGLRCTVMPAAASAAARAAAAFLGGREWPAAAAADGLGTGRAGLPAGTALLLLSHILRKMPSTRVSR
jgi:hypothetical protein